MRRLPILLVVALVLALLALAPASAAKPPCTKDPSHPSCKSDDPPTTDPEVCVFVDGVLQNWEPPESYRCQWTIPDGEQGKTFDFSLELAPEVDGATVNLPHLIVTDVFPSGGQICFNEYLTGWNPLPHAWSSFTLPEDGLCDGGGGDFVDNEPNVFAITIDVIKVKKGTVELTYTTK